MTKGGGSRRGMRVTGPKKGSIGKRWKGGSFVGLMLEHGLVMPLVTQNDSKDVIVPRELRRM
jgi:hypothetical protein